jgi:exopolysaccharide biosynthesis protein
MFLSRKLKRILSINFLACGLTCAAQNSPSASPVTYSHIVRRDPNFSIHEVTINLADPRVSTKVSRGGPAPDADGPWTTTLLPVSEIAAREGFDIAINGDFFSAKSTKDIEGRNTGYVRGKPATPEGMAMTDGQLWHLPKGKRPCLVITTNHTALLLSAITTAPTNNGAWEIIGGRQVLVRGGQPVEYTNAFALARNPRTAVGIDRTGTLLTLVVVDGRQPNLSIGMTLRELSAEMIALGCDTAINLDGGGSSTMAYRDPATHQLHVVNSPSDTKERSIADALGIIVHAPMPPAQ